jgi:Protein of unknown function (DUF1569)
MNSLAEPGAIDALITRLNKLHPERPRAWGRMTPNEMLCHLADSFAVGLGERPAAPMDKWLQRTVVKYVALRTSLTWPKGTRTGPEVEQGVGGTRPTDFEGDRARVVELLRRFAAGDARQGQHPFFGPLTREEWLIWGYRHTDHHLRQFAV